jgi:hypothetical protein
MSQPHKNNQACPKNKTSDEVCKSRLQHLTATPSTQVTNIRIGNRIQTSNPDCQRSDFERPLPQASRKWRRSCWSMSGAAQSCICPLSKSSTHVNATFLKCMDRGLLLVPELCTRCAVQSKSLDKSACQNGLYLNALHIKLFKRNLLTRQTASCIKYLSTMRSDQAVERKCSLSLRFCNQKTMQSDCYPMCKAGERIYNTVHSLQSKCRQK